MEQNREPEIEKRRNRGGTVDIGTKEEGAIVETININERLIIVKEKSIYEFVLADTLDPKRERPNLPSSVHTKILDRGSDDPVVARIFLTAKALFDTNYYPDSINVRKALLHTLEVVKELRAMEKEIEGYNSEHDKACNAYEERKGVPAYMLPSIPDMLTRCKTIFQKADHACQYIMDVIRLFYPEMSEKNYYTDFEKFVTMKYGENDHFSKFLQQVVPFIMEIRRAPNCFEHRKVELILTNFEIQDKGSLLMPTFEMNFDGSIIPRQDLHTYLSNVMKGLMNSFENMLPFLASKHIKPMGVIAPQIREVPEEKRRRKMVRFGIWLPFANEGFYAQ
jgi:hypothetical protein